MKQDEARKTTHHNTPSNKARQPGRHMKQPDTQREGPAQNWARTPQGTNRRGEGKAKEKTTAKTQAEPPTKQHNTEEPQHEWNRSEDQRQPEGKESTAPKTSKVRGPGGGQDHKRRAKRPPKSRSKWEQITKRCQRAIGTEDQTGAKRTSQVKGRGETKKEGGRYVILRVVYSR